ncbi:hypothetical protein [Paenibacillus ihumii]|nr:hypothetical protein [Paenibacillus ihumii]
MIKSRLIASCNIIVTLKFAEASHFPLELVKLSGIGPAKTAVARKIF